MFPTKLRPCTRQLNMEWLKDPNLKGQLQKNIGNRHLFIANSVRSPSEMQTGPRYCDNSETQKFISKVAVYIHQHVLLQQAIDSLSRMPRYGRYKKEWSNFVSTWDFLFKSVFFLVNLYVFFKSHWPTCICNLFINHWIVNVESFLTNVANMICAFI